MIEKYLALRARTRVALAPEKKQETKKMSLNTVVLYLLLLTAVTWYQGDGLTEQEILLECCQAWSCATNSNFNPPWTSSTDPCSGTAPLLRNAEIICIER